MPFICYYDKKEQKNVLACKLILIKSSAASLYQKQKEDFRPELETCPYCGSRGYCVPYASYERYILDFLDGHPVCETVSFPGSGAAAADVPMPS